MNFKNCIFRLFNYLLAWAFKLTAAVHGVPLTQYCSS